MIPKQGPQDWDLGEEGDFRAIETGVTGINAADDGGVAGREP